MYVEQRIARVEYNACHLTIRQAPTVQQLAHADAPALHLRNRVARLRLSSARSASKCHSQHTNTRVWVRGSCCAPMIMIPEHSPPRLAQRLSETLSEPRTSMSSLTPNSSSISSTR
jgi:hypothetical protein